MSLITCDKCGNQYDEKSYCTECDEIGPEPCEGCEGVELDNCDVCQWANDNQQ